MKQLAKSAGKGVRPTSTLVLALIAAGFAQEARAADFFWAGGYGNGTSNFADPANWAPNGVPGSNDRVVVSNGSNLEILGAHEIGALDFGPARLYGNGHLVIAGPSVWEGGSLFGPGSLTFNGDLDILSSSQGSHEVGGGATVVLNGTTTWHSSLNTGDTDIMFGASGLSNDSSLMRNNGTFIDVANGSAGSPRFTKSMGFWSIQGSYIFENSGIYIKQGAATTQMSLSFNNNGVVNVAEGKLYLFGGGKHTGSYSVSSGAQLEFRGSHEFSGVDFSGSGVVRFSGVSASFSEYNRIASSSLFLTSAAAVDVIEGGTLEIANLTQSGGAFRNDGNVVVGGQSIWSAGGLLGSGRFQFDGDFEIVQQVGWLDPKLVGPMTTVVLNGETLFGGGISLLGAVENYGVFVEGENAAGLQINGGGKFVNFGTYVKKNSALTAISSRFDNFGNARVHSGSRLFLSGGGVHGGLFSIDAGAILDFYDGNHVLDGASFAGDGTVRILGGSSSFVGGEFKHYGATHIQGGVVSVSSGSVLETGELRQSGGLLNLAGTITVSRGMYWTDGTIDGAGELRVDGLFDLSNSGSSRRIGGGAALVMNGDTLWNGASSHAEMIWFGSRHNDAARLVNNGIFLDHTDANNFKSMVVDQFYSAGGGGRFEFVNSGGYIKTGAGQTAFEIYFRNNGSVRVVEGMMDFRGGFSNHGLVTGSGRLAVRQPMTNSGEINPGDSVGELDIIGSVHFDVDSLLTIELSSLDSFDKLSIYNDAIFDGALHIVSVDGYSPDDGDSFVVAYFGSRGGSEFETVSWSGFHEGLSFDVVYGESDIRLVAMLAPVPEPGSYMMFISGLGFVAFILRRKNFLKE